MVLRRARGTALQLTLMSGTPVLPWGNNGTEGRSRSSRAIKIAVSSCCPNGDLPRAMTIEPMEEPTPILMTAIRVTCFLWMGSRRSRVSALQLFFFNDAATTEIYTLSLHDALPI